MTIWCLTPGSVVFGSKGMSYSTQHVQLAFPLSLLPGPASAALLTHDGISRILLLTAVT